MCACLCVYECIVYLRTGTFAYYDPHCFFCVCTFFGKNKAAVRMRDYIWRREIFMEDFRLFPVVFRYFYREIPTERGDFIETINATAICLPRLYFIAYWARMVRLN